MLIPSFCFSIIRTLLLQLYPAYASYKALRCNDGTVLPPWLMYWSVMGLIGVAETLADLFIFWFPFYYEMKFLFILWLILPQTQGSVFLYRTVVEPYFTQHEREIDKAIENYQSSIKQRWEELARRGLALLHQIVVDSLAKGQKLLAQQIGDQHPGSHPASSSSSSAQSDHTHARDAAKQTVATPAKENTEWPIIVNRWAGWLAASVTSYASEINLSSTSSVSSQEAKEVPGKSSGGTAADLKSAPREPGDTNEKSRHGGKEENRLNSNAQELEPLPEAGDILRHHRHDEIENNHGSRSEASRTNSPLSDTGNSSTCATASFESAVQVKQTPQRALRNPMIVVESYGKEDREIDLDELLMLSPEDI
ncbi:uncharacterized protein VTP21DRAFT_78 [Calcarisporiella thermophila]|uniref:uncharacterized protein n=1 Tax=Calcarisporiella thermophila TaxID=911321 RepID=UPI0037440FFB